MASYHGTTSQLLCALRSRKTLHRPKYPPGVQCSGDHPEFASQSDPCYSGSTKAERLLQVVYGALVRGLCTCISCSELHRNHQRTEAFDDTGRLAAYIFVAHRMWARATHISGHLTECSAVSMLSISCIAQILILAHYHLDVGSKTHLARLTFRGRSRV
jgi:hypothetical protein